MRSYRNTTLDDENVDFEERKEEAARETRVRKADESLHLKQPGYYPDDFNKPAEQERSCSAAPGSGTVHSERQLDWHEEHRWR